MRTVIERIHLRPVMLMAVSRSRKAAEAVEFLEVDVDEVSWESPRWLAVVEGGGWGCQTDGVNGRWTYLNAPARHPNHTPSSALSPKERATTRSVAA